jgi:hypothetical protein
MSGEYYDDESKHSLEAFDAGASRAAILEDQENHLLPETNSSPSYQRKPNSLSYLLPRRARHWCSRNTCRQGKSRWCTYPRRSLLRKFKAISYTFSASILILIFTTFIFFPSYTILPRHYQELGANVANSTDPGRGNVHQEKVFIAASLYDPGARLIGGRWAENVLELIDLLGPDNTYLSIYENESGEEARLAMSELDRTLPCNRTLTFEDHLGLEGVPNITLPDGTSRVKRIEYLAQVRNKALKPLEEAEVLFDKVLYLNDVFFNPLDAVQLLFSTHINEEGQADYRAACAVDFINPFKFYDTFATRDLGGFSPGVPFFPWVAYGGDSRSHTDILQGTDAVRVRSCWGGMVAFDAKFFQPGDAVLPATAASLSLENITAPYRFRAESDLYWDASECCLIQADIQNPNPDDTGIYMNPFVRCAYDPWSQSWLWLTRRIERLYTPIHFMIDILVSLPKMNPRRAEQPWEEVEESVWQSNVDEFGGGSFRNVSRHASHAGFCGRRKLAVMKEHFIPGQRNWENIPLPSI